MDKIEYNALKKIARTEAGADDFESLQYYGQIQLRNAKWVKRIALFICIMSVPAMLLVIGIPIFIMGLCLYFFGYRKARKKAEGFMQHLAQDPEFT